MAEPNAPQPTGRPHAKASSEGGMVVPTPPLPEQAPADEASAENLSDATKAEREAGTKAMKENVNRTQAEQEAGKKAMGQRSDGATPGARPRPAQPNAPSGSRPNPLHGTQG